MPSTPFMEHIAAQLHTRLLQLRAETRQVERALAALNGATPKHRESREAPPKKAKRTKRKVHVSNGQPKRTVRDYIVDLLQKTPGLTAAELTTQMLADGWQTTSRRPDSVVYQELSGARGKTWARRDDQGRWTLKERA